MRAIGFGSIVLDVLMDVSRIELGIKNPTSHQVLQVGGVVPTALMVLSRLGVKSELYSMVGNDEIGRTLFNFLEKEGVTTDNVISGNKYTPVACVIVNSETGERTTFYSTGEFSTVSERVFEKRFNGDCNLLILDGHNARISKIFLQKARISGGTKVFLDMGNPKRGMEGLVGECDVVVVPQAYWKRKWPRIKARAVVEKFLDKGARVVIVTMGESGCVVGEANGEVFDQRAFAIEAIDTNGAGDIFLGVLAYAILAGWDLHRSALLASGAAALGCTRFGKENKMPRSIEEIKSFIASFENVVGK